MHEETSICSSDHVAELIHQLSLINNLDSLRMPWLIAVELRDWWLGSQFALIRTKLNSGFRAITNSLYSSYFLATDNLIPTINKNHFLFVFRILASFWWHQVPFTAWVWTTRSRLPLIGWACREQQNAKRKVQAKRMEKVLFQCQICLNKRNLDRMRSRFI